MYSSDYQLWYQGWKWWQVALVWGAPGLTVLVILLLEARKDRQNRRLDDKG